MSTILEFLGQNAIVPLFVILGLGLLIGRIRIGGVDLGGVTGVLFVGLVFGHYGFSLPAASLNLGFILFIFCVGVQAGPQFITAFKKDGKKYAVLAFITAGTALTLAALFAKIFDFELGRDAGLLAGALTSTPTLVAAQDAIRAGLKNTGGLSADQVLGNLTSAYAVVYVFGLAGLVIFMSLLPRLFRIDVAAEAQQYESESGGSGGVERALRMSEVPTTRAYRVDKHDFTNGEWSDVDWKIPGDVQRVKRGNEVFEPGYDFQFQIGDIVSLVGNRRAHEYALEHVGPEIVDYDVLDRSTTSRRIMVSSGNTVGRTIADMHFTAKYHCILTQVIRSGIDMPRRPDLKLERGDVLALTGPHSQLDGLAEELGYREGIMEKTDLVSFAFGIAIGVIIGLFSVSVGGIKVGLGSAGGCLLAGLLFGILNSRRPTLARFPAAARNLLMELGLLLFMANVAIDAGAEIVETVTTAGPTLALCGLAITLSPVIISFVVGRYAFKMNSALLLGALTGAMTSTPSLTQVTKLAKSSVPTLGYVGTYAFANVLMAVAGTIVMVL